MTQLQCTQVRRKKVRRLMISVQRDLSGNILIQS